MKYKIYLEHEYKDFNGDLEADKEIECDEFWLYYELKDYCDYLYSDRDGWEWMKDSFERILTIDENGKTRYFTIEVDFKPVLYVTEDKQNE